MDQSVCLDNSSLESFNNEDVEIEIDPITDIIDYLVHCVKIAFKPAHVNGVEVSSRDNTRAALQLFNCSPIDFLTQFGKYLKPSHLSYFENLVNSRNYSEQENLKRCVEQLKIYHSNENTHKRIRNRRYKALQKLRAETEYFSEKEMMLRNPLLYEQLVGQFLTDEEIRERDETDSENITLLKLVLDTIDRNEMREVKNLQIDSEGTVINEENTGTVYNTSDEISHWGSFENTSKSSTQWGAFDVSDSRPSFKPEERKTVLISAPERELLREEFIQEMYSSFIEGRDTDFNYENVDNDEQYDDLQQINQDAEDKYFDSETNEVQNLEEHMELSLNYRRDSDVSNEDPLDVFMEHLNERITME
ncbi:Coiled-coil domain-containing protein 97 [Eumeta japonica]|uniref:Coiled-coil domain-containing protein 97 n=1 Tax=Eumeta variegata TaxID=151549 RepID=A0A4C1W0Q4_EUMVA|nr:Coiled-coil domain-containing protein 97 [Eumeta japonica]